MRLNRPLGTAVVLLLGCGFDSSGKGLGATLGDASTDSSTESGTTQADSQSSNTATPTTADDATATGSSTSDGPTSTTDDPSSGMPTDGVDPTDPATSTTSMSTTGPDDTDSSDGGDSTTTGDPATGSSTTNAVPVEVSLQNTDQDDCNGPMWCVEGAIDNPNGTPTDTAECFVSPVDAPYEVTELSFQVWDSAAVLADFTLQIRQSNAGSPGAVIQSFTVPADMGQAGTHVFTLPDPVQLEDTRFCIGFSMSAAGLADAIGMAVDIGSGLEGTSYIRMNGSGGCDLPNWTDFVAANFGGAGNWCLSPTIREVL